MVQKEKKYQMQMEWIFFLPQYQLINPFDV